MITPSLTGVQGTWTWPDAGSPRVQLSSAGNRQGKPGLKRHSPVKEGGQGERESQWLCASPRQIQIGDGNKPNFYLCQSKLGRAGTQGPQHQGRKFYRQIKAKNGVLSTLLPGCTEQGTTLTNWSHPRGQQPHSPMPGLQDTVPQVQMLPKHHNNPVRFGQCHQPLPTHRFWGTTAQLSIPS